MKLIIGLGNPGKKYSKNRHNVGYLFIDHLSQRVLPGNIIVKKTNIFMNGSGSFVKGMVKKYKLKPDDLFVVHDDLDIPLGQFKIQKGVSPKLHNGINSINDSLLNSDYWRVRIGVDNRRGNNRVAGIKYVLEDFSAGELERVEEVVKKAASQLVHKLKNE